MRQTESNSPNAFPPTSPTPCRQRGTDRPCPHGLAAPIPLPIPPAAFRQHAAAETGKQIRQKTAPGRPPQKIDNPVAGFNKNLSYLRPDFFNSVLSGQTPDDLTFQFKLMKTTIHSAGKLIFLTILFFIPAGCNLEEINVEQPELTFTQNGESKKFSVIYTGKWRLEATGLERYYGPDKADVRDFTVEPVSGKGNTQVTVTLKNDLTESYDVALKVVTENSHLTIKLKAVAN
jgi:hypothetical protein